MADGAPRLMRLLILLQARRDWTGADLAERMDVTVRTVRRDVDRLRSLGYTIDSRPGEAGGYRLGFGTGIPPLLLDAEEAVAVAVALRSSTTSGLAGGGEASLQALLKLEQTLPSALRRRVGILQKSLLHLSGPGPQIEVDTLIGVATAAADSQRLRIRYRTHRGTELQRLVEPHRLVQVGSLWYLVAWDLDRDDWRTYRLDRVQSYRRLDGRFTPRGLADGEVGALVSNAITSSPYPVRCRLTVLAPAEAVGELVGPARGQVRPVTDTTCEVTGGSVSLTEMALWVARLGVDVIIHEPVELRSEVSAIAGRLERAATSWRP